MRATLDELKSCVDGLTSDVNARFDRVLESIGGAAAGSRLAAELLLHAARAECPRIFTLIPAEADAHSPEARGFFKKVCSRVKGVVVKTWHLYLLCEGHDGTPHFVPGVEAFNIAVPKPFLVKAAPYLKIMSSVLSIAVKAATGVTVPDFLRDVDVSGVARLLDAACVAAAAVADVPVEALTSALESAAAATASAAAAAAAADAALPVDTMASALETAAAAAEAGKAEAERVAAVAAGVQGDSDAAIAGLRDLLESIQPSAAAATRAREAGLQCVSASGAAGTRVYVWVCEECAAVMFCGARGCT